MNSGLKGLLLNLLLCLGAALPLLAQTDDTATASLDEYFRLETERLSRASLDGIQTLNEWEEQRPRRQQQLCQMLGLWPWPERHPLQAVITGVIEHELFTVEKLHFQSLPGLYITANFYLPRERSGPVPAILYLSGHARVMQDGISYGNKVGYQHHGAWLARHGYACLVLDTIQLGEIEGVHHGTHREGMWWWNAIGYTPAGVEAWNGIRAIDYLQSRPEVDGERIGATGRSGGGAYTWWVAALDERVKAAAPVAGITDLHNHVVDGVVEGHCDCMFMVNTYQWDYPAVAALVAPRPLLIANTDKDRIFPLDGVVRVHAKIKPIYDLYKQPDHLGLLITEGGHRDSQDLQMPVLRWFNRFLKGEDPLIENAAVRHFQPQELKVFETLPESERTSRIHESFVPWIKGHDLPESQEEWTQMQKGWIEALRTQVFAAWPDQGQDHNFKKIASAENGPERIQLLQVFSQPGIELPLIVVTRDGSQAVPLRAVLHILDERQWQNELAALAGRFPAFFSRFNSAAPVRSVTGMRDDPGEPIARVLDLPGENEALILLAPRGAGPTAFPSDIRKQTQIRRRFMLLGQTADGMRVWDIVCGVKAAREFLPAGSSLRLEAREEMAVNALYATLFSPEVESLLLIEPPHSHLAGPDYLNALKFLDVPQAAAMVAERSSLTLTVQSPGDWWFLERISRTGVADFSVKLQSVEPRQ